MGEVKIEGWGWEVGEEVILLRTKVGPRILAGVFRTRHLNGVFARLSIFKR